MNNHRSIVHTLMLILTVTSLLGCVPFPDMPVLTSQPAPTLTLTRDSQEGIVPSSTTTARALPTFRASNTPKVSSMAVTTPAVTNSPIIGTQVTLEPPRPTPTSNLPTVLPSSTLVISMGEILSFDACKSIWRIDVAGEGQKELLYTDDLCKGVPELAPNGQWVAYSAGEQGQDLHSVWLLDIDARDAWQVSEPMPGLNWDWLPNSTLLYTEYPSYLFDPYGDAPPDYGTDYRSFVHDPSTRKSTRVEPMPFSSLYTIYQISATEEKILAVKNGEDALLLMNLDGTEPREVLPNYPWSSVAWSRDGKYVAYNPRLSPPAIRVVAIDKDRIHQVQHLVLDDDHRKFSVLNWSPDDNWIAFEDFAESGSRLCVIHVRDGQEKCFNVAVPGPIVPWSPDSSTIAVAHKGSQADSTDVYLVHISDGEIIRLTHDSNFEYYLLWR